MSNVTHSKIIVKTQGENVSNSILQSRWSDGNTVRILVLSGNNAYEGENVLLAPSIKKNPSLNMESPSHPDIEVSKKLIQLVKDKPFLYDKGLEDYRDEAKKTETWKAIAESLHLGVEETQIRWARLRVDFGRHRRKRQAAESCGSTIRNWSLYGLLTWLAPHVKMRAKRVKRKRDKLQESYNYKPILPRPDWLMNVDGDDGGVSVEVNPSIVMQNGHEDITESFIVSPDTADYDDEASHENTQVPYGKREFGTRKLSQTNIEGFVERHELELSNFIEEMRAALGATTTNESFLYALEENHFSWKRKLSSGLIAKRGEIKVQDIQTQEAYASVLHKSLDEIHSLHKLLGSLREENSLLRKDRDIALEKVKEFADLKEDWEKKLYGRFVIILNSKKERIRVLEEDLGLYTRGQDECHIIENKSGIKNSSSDNYGSETDLDSEGDDVKEEGEEPSSPLPSSSLRRHHDIFDSFESPGSPVPILPKRARRLEQESVAESKSAGGVFETTAASSSNLSPQAEDERTESQPLASDENTQDLLDNI